MALDEIWKIHSIERVPNGGTALDVANDTIAAITEVSMPVQASVTREVTAGDIFASSGRIDFTSVDISFTSLMAKAMINLMGNTSAQGMLSDCIAPGGDSYNVYAARYACDGPAAGAVHRRYTITKGILHMVSMNCDHKGDVAIGAMLKAVYDGVNAPVAVSEGVALPDEAQIGSQNDRWTLGDGTHTTTNANAVAGKRSVNIDFAVNTSSQGADSDIYDTFAAVDSALPVISVSGVDPEWFNSLGLTINGVAVTHANTIFKFRKRDGAGGFLGTDAIQVAANGPAYFDDLFSASGVEAATCSFKIEPIKASGGEAPILFTTGVAL